MFYVCLPKSVTKEILNAKLVVYIPAFIVTQEILSSKLLVV